MFTFCGFFFLHAFTFNITLPFVSLPLRYTICFEFLFCLFAVLAITYKFSISHSKMYVCTYLGESERERERKKRYVRGWWWYTHIQHATSHPSISLFLHTSTNMHIYICCSHCASKSFIEIPCTLSNMPTINFTFNCSAFSWCK